MKAGVVHAREDIRYEEIEKPQALPGKVVIKVKYTGIYFLEKRNYFMKKILSNT